MADLQDYLPFKNPSKEFNPRMPKAGNGFQQKITQDKWQFLVVVKYSKMGSLWRAEANYLLCRIYQAKSIFTKQDCMH